tara:strand:- start:240 stop:521 length:282 start_codon:yes stop_codon:yes gene_type:complete
MNWNNVTQSEEVIALIKQREAINDNIKLIDENALINYELEALNIPLVSKPLPVGKFCLLIERITYIDRTLTDVEKIERLNELVDSTGFKLVIA